MKENWFDPYPGSGPFAQYILDSRYLPIRFIMEGGFSTTYFAADLVDEKSVVLKTPRREYVESAISDLEKTLILKRFEREAQAMISLPKSRYIVEAHYLFNHKCMPVLVVELIEGGSLSKLLKSDIERYKQIPFAMLIKLVDDIASGLAIAADAGIIHRDIKPANLLLRSDLTVAVADFGLSLIYDVSEPLKNLSIRRKTGSDSNLFFGTSQYSAPEVLEEGIAVATQRSDLFSFGVTVIELLTMRIPRRKSDGSLQMNWDAPSLNRVRKFIEPCLELNPTNRPSSFREILDEIRYLLKMLNPKIYEVKNNEDIGDKTPSDLGQAITKALFDPEKAVSELIHLKTVSKPDQDSMGLIEANLAYVLGKSLNRLEEGLDEAFNAIRLSKAGSLARILGHINSAFCLTKMGKPEEALKHCKLAEEEGYDKHAATIEPLITTKIVCLLSLDKLDEAIKTFDIGKDLIPTAGEPAEAIGEYFANHDRRKESLSYFEYAASRMPTSIAALFNLGCSYMYLNRHDDAIKTLRRAYSLNPHDHETLETLSRALYAKGNIDSSVDAAAVFNDLAEQAVNVYESFIKRIELLKRQADSHLVDDILNNIQFLYLHLTKPLRQHIIAELVRVASIMDRVDALIKHYKICKEVLDIYCNHDPSNFILLGGFEYEIGKAYLKEKQLEIALIHFQNSLDCDKKTGSDDEAQSLIAIGKTKYLLNRIEEAEKTLREALELLKDSDHHEAIAEASFAMGILLDKKGSQIEVIDFFEKAFKYYQQLGLIHFIKDCSFRLFSLYNNIGNSEKAAYYLRIFMDIIR